MKNQSVMTEGPIWKKILYFSIPLILGNLFQQMYNTVDSIIVGNYIGSEALAAVGSSGSIINLLIGFCVGASAGAGVVISQYYGAQNKEGVRKAVHTTIAISIVAGLIMTVAGVLLVPVILRMMGTPGEVFKQAVIYLQVYFGGIFFSVIYNMSAGILNAVGNSRRSLLYLIIAAVSNIFLDLLFVVVLRMGIIGAALATDVSQFISCIFILAFLIRSKEVYRLKIREIRFYDNLLFRILKIGLPTGLQNIVISISNVIVQSSVNSFGAVAMAGFAAYIKIDGFNILPVLSFSMAATTFTGQNIGAGKYDRVKKGMYVSVTMGIIYTILTGILLLMFAPQVIGVFTTRSEVVEYGVYIMKFFCPFYWMLGFLHVMAGTIRGTGKTMQAMAVFLFSLCLFRIAWIWTALRITRKLFGVMSAYPTSWFVGALIIFVYAWKGKWMPESYYKEKA
ncbi:MATE family efflux transporter [Faecalicatena contorta]|uniref:MATE family efflux transporter n=1 Tax=Faecalicatena contorta TaxID=39482 RepID=UPI001F16F3D4|nr:MATE family efflux transporter [Faecalicatena contorta]MCF2681257.1 MATE family efflux transporter [Faecalicatena contorta]